jgi:hypothetical protein
MSGIFDQPNALGTSNEGDFNFREDWGNDPSVHPHVIRSVKVPQECFHRPGFKEIHDYIPDFVGKYICEHYSGQDKQACFARMIGVHRNALVADCLNDIYRKAKGLGETDSSRREAPDNKMLILGAAGLCLLGVIAVVVKSRNE